MKRLWIAFACTSLAMPAVLHAQDVSSGQRVRLRTFDGESVAGTLLEITPSEYRIRDDDTELRLDRVRVVGIERSLGGQRRFLRNLLITVGVSAVALGSISAIADDGTCTDGPFGCMGPGGAFVIGSIAGGLYAIPIGVIVGLAVRSERWEPAPLPASASLILGPIGAGHMAFGVSIPAGW